MPPVSIPSEARLRRFARWACGLTGVTILIGYLIAAIITWDQDHRMPTGVGVLVVIIVQVLLFSGWRVGKVSAGAEVHMLREELRAECAALHEDMAQLIGRAAAPRLAEAPSGELVRLPTARVRRALEQVARDIVDSAGKDRDR